MSQTPQTFSFFATELVQDGVSIYEVQKLLWHSSAELVEDQQQSGIFPDSNPGTLDDQASEERIASLGDASGDLTFAPGVFAGD